MGDLGDVAEAVTQEINEGPLQEVSFQSIEQRVACLLGAPSRQLGDIQRDLVWAQAAFRHVGFGPSHNLQRFVEMGHNTAAQSEQRRSILNNVLGSHMDRLHPSAAEVDWVGGERFSSFQQLVSGIDYVLGLVTTQVVGWAAVKAYAGSYMCRSARGLSELRAPHRSTQKEPEADRAGNDILSTFEQQLERLRQVLGSEAAPWYQRAAEEGQVLAPEADVHVFPDNYQSSVRLVLRQDGDGIEPFPSSGESSSLSRSPGFHDHGDSSGGGQGSAALLRESQLLAGWQSEASPAVPPSCPPPSSGTGF